MSTEQAAAFDLADPASVDRAIRGVLGAPWRLAQVCKVEIQGAGPVPFDLTDWPHQREVLELAVCYREVIVLKARQLGVTWALALLALWDCMALPSGLTLVVSLGEDEATEFVTRVRFLYKSLPAWLRRRYPVGLDNTANFGIKHGDGISAVRAISSSGNAGRSKTARRVIADERARWVNSRERMASIRPTIADRGSMIEVSTANGYDEFRDTYMGAIPGPESPITNGYRQDSEGYRRIFIGALARPGRDMDWVMRERRKLGELGPQELPLTDLEAFIASGACDFSLEALQWYLDNFVQPAPWRGVLRDGKAGPIAEKLEYGPWRVWETPRDGRSYLITADSSGGGGSADPSAIAVYDTDSWDLVAAYHGKPDPAALTTELIRAGYLWKGPDSPALMAPEANNHGQAVVAYLLSRGYPRLYEPERFDIAQGGTRAGRSHGWLMSGRSKETAISALQECVRDKTLGLRDPEALAEMVTFSAGQALEGYHDDRVICHAIAAAILTFSSSTAPITSEPEEPYWRPKDRRAGY